MPPVYGPQASTPGCATQKAATAHKASVPVPRLAAPVSPLNSLRRSKFRIPILQVLADMAPGCGMPLRTLAIIISEEVGTKQANLDYFCSNLVQTTIGYQDRSKANRFEPTLIGLGYVATDDIEVEEGCTETIYYLTVAGRTALEHYSSMAASLSSSASE